VARVTLNRVTKRFGNSIAVDNLDIDLAPHALSTLLGPSGCGKTTTLRLIAGLEHPTSGRILIGDTCVFGADTIVPTERRNIGMVFQSYAVWPHLSVFENVAYPLRMRRASRHEIRKRVDQALNIVDLYTLRDRLPAQLSGGQQQRVALARAVVAEPSILLLDEPLSNLDARLRDQLGTEIRELQKKLGLTAVYVTHDQHEALALSDFIVVMNDGRALQSGSPRELYEKPNCRFVAEFLGWKNFLPADRVEKDSVTVLGVRMPCDTSGVDLTTSSYFHATIRPERISLAPVGLKGGAQWRLVGRVERITYHGAYVSCELSLSGHHLQAWVLPNAEPLIDTDVEIALDPAAIRVVPDELGEFVGPDRRRTRE
jgi:iron(III) transport system ATP-binding protein